LCMYPNPSYVWVPSHPNVYRNCACITTLLLRVASPKSAGGRSGFRMWNDSIANVQKFVCLWCCNKSIVSSSWRKLSAPKKGGNHRYDLKTCLLLKECYAIPPRESILCTPALLLDYAPFCLFPSHFGSPMGNTCGVESNINQVQEDWGDLGPFFPLFLPSKKKMRDIVTISLYL